MDETAAWFHIVSPTTVDTCHQAELKCYNITTAAVQGGCFKYNPDSKIFFFFVNIIILNLM